MLQSALSRAIQQDTAWRLHPDATDPVLQAQRIELLAAVLPDLFQAVGWATLHTHLSGHPAPSLDWGNDPLAVLPTVGRSSAVLAAADEIATRRAARAARSDDEASSPDDHSEDAPAADPEALLREVVERLWLEPPVADAPGLQNALAHVQAVATSAAQDPITPAAQWSPAHVQLVVEHLRLYARCVCVTQTLPAELRVLAQALRHEPGALAKATALHDRHRAMRDLAAEALAGSPHEAKEDPITPERILARQRLLEQLAPRSWHQQALPPDA